MFVYFGLRLATSFQYPSLKPYLVGLVHLAAHIIFFVCAYLFLFLFYTQFPISAQSNLEVLFGGLCRFARFSHRLHTSTPRLLRYYNPLSSSDLYFRLFPFYSFDFSPISASLSFFWKMHIKSWLSKST